MSLLKKYIQITEEAIKQLGVNPEDTRGDKEGQWNLQYGDYPIWVDLYEKEDNVYFQIVSPILKADEHPDKMKLLEAALEINDGLIFGSISLHQDTLWMRNIMPVDFLDTEKILKVLQNLGNAALRYGEFLRTNV